MDPIDANDLQSDTPPQKYIRTFEHDMEQVQSGVVPDLAPVPTAAPMPAPVQEVAPIPAPPPQPEPEEIPNPLATPEERLIAGSPLDENGPMDAVVIPPAPAPAPPAPPPAPTGPAPLHTYAGDFSDRMTETHASQATILAAEQDAGPEPGSAPPPRTGSVLYTIAGLLFFALGAGGLYYGYTHYLQSSAPVQAVSGVSTPIFVNEEEQVSGTSTALAQTVEQSAMRPLTPGTVRLLYSANATSTGESVFSALQLGAPDVLLRNINAAGSMAGIVNAGGSQYPFFILSVASYGDTFAGMLQWESTMPHSLALFYPAFTPPTAASTASTTATSTALTSPTRATTTPLTTQAPGFTDQVIANHDARVYRDAYGQVDIVYGYWNATTLIIAHDAAAFTELVNRFATSRAP
jgi:hypothetical protein